MLHIIFLILASVWFFLVLLSLICAMFPSIKLIKWMDYIVAVLGCICGFLLFLAVCVSLEGFSVLSFTH